MRLGNDSSGLEIVLKIIVDRSKELCESNHVMQNKTQSKSANPQGSNTPHQHLEAGHCVIAVSPNSWGRGETVADALKQLVRAGGTRSKAQLRFIVGDSRAYVSDMGDLMIHNGAISYKI